jgi:hypothetical protein
MATRRPHYRRAPRAPVRPPLSYSISNWIMTFASIAMVVIVGYLAWPVLLHNFQAGTSSAPPLATPAPTLAPMQRQQLQQAAPQTAVEQQAVQQAVPTADTRQPPLLPAQATAAAVQQPIVNADEARQYSPVDLGWAPLPTPTTMLSQEQYDASQASEEQNFLNNAEQGLTEAQKLVKIHEAEQNAKAQP